MKVKIIKSGPFALDGKFVVHLEEDEIMDYDPRHVEQIIESGYGEAVSDKADAPSEEETPEEEVALDSFQEVEVPKKRGRPSKKG